MEHLSKRETQLMEALYRRGEAAVAELRDDLEEAPSYSTVRALMGVLVEKGHAVRREEGGRYVYRPAVAREQAGRGMLKRVLTSFFGGSPERLISALIDEQSDRLTPEEADRLRAEIARAFPEEERPA